MNRRTFLGGLASAGAMAMVPHSFSATLKTDELSRHRVASLEVKRVAQKWPRLVGKNARLDVHGWGPTSDVCIIKTDQGASGWGMMRGSTQDLKKLEPTLLGKTVSELFAPEIGFRSPDLRILDLPLHDLAGVILGVPVWKLIGGTEPVITKIYSGMIYFDELEPADKPRGMDIIMEECRWDYAYGYRQFKAKIGRGNKWMPAEAGLQRDIEVVKAIAKAFPDCEILVDSNNGYSLETAIRFLQGVEGIPLFWVEEPFHETLDDWRKLHTYMREHGRAKTYRADGEANPDTKVLDQLGAEGVVNLRLEDIMGYGFTEWRAFLPRLAKQNVAASPHAWGAGLKSIYIGHLAAGLGNIPTIEGVSFNQDDVDLGDNRIVNGKFHPSSAPGFGIKLKVK